MKTLPRKYTSAYNSFVICGKNGLPSVRFDNGRFTASTEEEVKTVEGNQGFGTYIFLEEPTTPIEDLINDPEAKNAEKTKKENEAPENMFECEECKAQFETKRQLAGHMMRHKR